MAGRGEEYTLRIGEHVNTSGVWWFVVYLDLHELLLW